MGIQLGPDPRKWPEPYKSRYAERLRASRTVSPIELALQTCIESVKLIPGEQSKLLALLQEETNPIKRNYLEYQADLVDLQLTRAAKTASQRLAYFRAVADWDVEKTKCKADIHHWFNQWAWTLDPRPDSPLSVVPFALFDFQADVVDWLNRLVFIQRSDGAVEKSRDQGWTWISTAWSTFHWTYRPYFQVLFGSKNEDAVDSIEEPDTILEKVRFQLRLTPKELLPKGFDYKKHQGFMKITNPENGSVIAGEAPIPNFGRSGRYSCVFFDEHAAFPHSGRPQWTSASASSKSKISASTPQGTLTRQAELVKSGKIPVKTLKWTLHPWKDKRWYEGQTLSMDDQEIAQEIDIDYEASQPGPVYAKLWDKAYHVITWSEFARVFKVKAKPHHWLSRIYQDVGTSPDHPTATGFWTKPAMRDRIYRTEIKGESYTYDLSECAFLYRTHTIFDEEIGNIWDELANLMRPARERDHCQAYYISHEAESERKTLRKNNVSPAPVAWKPGANRGIAEFKDALKIANEDKPNPFKPELWGFPKFMLIVADDQYDEPMDDFGGARFQAEVAAYHFPKQVLGEPVKAQKPYAFFNDHMDQSRMAAADFWPISLEMTRKERIIEAVPDKYKPETLKEAYSPEREMSVNFQMERAKQAVKTRSWQQFDMDGNLVEDEN